MSELIQEKKKKKLSKELQEALDAIPVPNFEKLQPKVDRVFEIGRTEKLTDKEIGKEIRKKMKEHYSQSTIQRVFEYYPEAKQQQNHEKVVKKTTFDEEPKTEENKTDDEKETDKFRNYKETIAAKNKIIKQQVEEISGLKKQLVQANKRIHELETELNKTAKPKPKLKQGTMQQKQDLLTKALAFRQERIEQERRKSSDE